MTPQASGTMDKVFNPARAGMEGSVAENPPMEGKLEQVRENAQSLFRRTRDRAVELEGQFEGYVREHPVKSVLVASAIGASVGLLVGVLVSRR